MGSYMQWIYHGEQSQMRYHNEVIYNEYENEVHDNEVIYNEDENEEHDNDDEIQTMLEEVSGRSFANFSDETKTDNNVCGNMSEKEAKKFDKLLEEAECELYPGCLGLGYISIHVCKNDCMLYWAEHKDRQECPHCATSRWKIDNGKDKKIPHKVLRYFPFKPRLQRLFMSSKTSVDMRWHKEKHLDEASVLRHPADSKAWKEFDKNHQWFAQEPRNIRLGLATDGFNPFGNMSTSYSMLPVILAPYNLPPWKCLKDPFMIMSLLIPGPQAPGKDIDVYMYPLIDELKELWNDGVETFDASTGKCLKMHAAILWTINDFLAYEKENSEAESDELHIANDEMYQDISLENKIVNDSVEILCQLHRDDIDSVTLDANVIELEAQTQHAVEIDYNDDDCNQEDDTIIEYISDHEENEGVHIFGLIENKADEIAGTVPLAHALVFALCTSFPSKSNCRSFVLSGSIFAETSVVTSGHPGGVKPTFVVGAFLLPIEIQTLLVASSEVYPVLYLILVPFPWRFHVGASQTNVHREHERERTVLLLA
ncbi:hypothetical protein MTR67_026585 [Solanum verrucosum]|uniref:Uncharacterized protein n=1 Tax=Solanum verrucosum TaxID=315347 RepID=A0AAF0R2J0_SOLVR|nr:hypothetical protein MTR67_026585 [Solanum verrucosum]